MWLIKRNIRVNNVLLKITVFIDNCFLQVIIFLVLKSMHDLHPDERGEGRVRESALHFTLWLTECGTDWVCEWLKNKQNSNIDVFLVWSEGHVISEEEGEFVDLAYTIDVDYINQLKESKKLSDKEPGIPSSTVMILRGLSPKKKSTLG